MCPSVCKDTNPHGTMPTLCSKYNRIWQNLGNELLICIIQFNNISNESFGM